MSTVADLMGLGTPAAVAARLGYTPTTVAGIGTVQNGAAILGATALNLLTVAGGNTAFILSPHYSTGRPVFVWNTDAATAAVVFPPLGGTFNNQSINASVSIPAGDGAIFQLVDGTGLFPEIWFAIVGGVGGGGGGLPTDGFDNQALLFGNPPFWGTDIIGRTGDDDFPIGDTVTLTGGDALSPTVGSAGGVRLTGGISGPGQTASQFLIENTSGGEGGLININAGSDGTGGSIGAIINMSAGGFAGSGHGGDIELVPGTGTSPGFLLLTNLGTSAPAQPTGVWNNSGVLNIGPGGGGGGGGGNTLVLTADTNIAAGTSVSVNSSGHAVQTWGPAPSVSSNTVLFSGAPNTNYGTPATNSGWGVTPLGSGNFIMFGGPGQGAAPLSVSGNSITLGTVSTNSLLEAIKTQDGLGSIPTVAALSSTAFVAAYPDPISTNINVVVGTISGGVVTIGTAVQVDATTSIHISIIALTSTSFTLAYQRTSDGSAQAVVGTVSGTTITLGALQQLAATPGNDEIMGAFKISTTSVLYSYTNAAALAAFCVGTISGTTLTLHTETSTAALSPNQATALLSSTLFVATSNNNGTFGQVIAGAISGTSVTLGSVVNFTYTAVAPVNLDATNFIIACGNAPIAPITGSVSGTAVTLGSVAVLPKASSSQINTTGNVPFQVNLGVSEALAVLSPTVVIFNDNQSFIYQITSGALSGAVAHQVLGYWLYPINSTSALALLWNLDLSLSLRVVNSAANTSLGPIGCSASAVTSGNPATIVLSGSCAGFTGLTPGAQYYANGDGSLTTANIGHPMGVATSTTQLTVIVK